MARISADGELVSTLLEIHKLVEVSATGEFRRWLEAQATVIVMVLDRFAPEALMDGLCVYEEHSVEPGAPDAFPRLAPDLSELVDEIEHRLAGLLRLRADIKEIARLLVEKGVVAELPPAMRATVDNLDDADREVSPLAVTISDELELRLYRTLELDDR